MNKKPTLLRCQRTRKMSNKNSKMPQHCKRLTTMFSKIWIRWNSTKSSKATKKWQWAECLAIYRLIFQRKRCLQKLITKTLKNSKILVICTEKTELLSTLPKMWNLYWSREDKTFQSMSLEKEVCHLAKDNLRIWSVIRLEQCAQTPTWWIDLLGKTTWATRQYQVGSRWQRTKTSIRGIFLSEQNKWTCRKRTTRKRMCTTPTWMQCSTQACFWRPCRISAEKINTY